MSDTILIEQYLTGTLEGSERLVVEARLLVDPQFSATCESQRQTYALVKAYGRQCLRQEIEAVHKRLFSEPQFHGFRTKIHELFKRKR